MHITSSTKSVTIEKVRSTFALFGIPEALVTDCGTNFTSAEFEEFLKSTEYTIPEQHHIPQMALPNGLCKHYKSGMKRLTSDTLKS